MIIGVDIDGVLTNVQDYVFEYGSKKLYESGMPLRDINKTEYDSSKIFNWNKKTDNEFWFDMIVEYVSKERPRIFASEVLKKLHKNNKIVLITARKNEVYEGELIDIEGETKKWLKANEISYDKLIFAGNDKRPSIQEEKVDVMIEDSPQNIELLKEYTDIIVFDAMYNKECKEFIRVNSWYEILYAIKSIAEEKNIDLEL